MQNLCTSRRGSENVPLFGSFRCFFNDANFEGEGREKWVAAPGGYVKMKEDRDLTIEEMGAILAVQTMKELLRSWN